MTNPYMTQALAQAKIDAMVLAGAARTGGTGGYIVRRAKPHGRIRAWLGAQLHRPSRPATTRPAASLGQVATCSR